MALFTGPLHKPLRNPCPNQSPNSKFYPCSFSLSQPPDHIYQFSPTSPLISNFPLLLTILPSLFFISFPLISNFTLLLLLLPKNSKIPPSGRQFLLKTYIKWSKIVYFTPQKCKVINIYVFRHLSITTSYF